MARTQPPATQSCGRRPSWDAALWHLHPPGTLARVACSSSSSDEMQLVNRRRRAGRCLPGQCGAGQAHVNVPPTLPPPPLPLRASQCQLTRRMAPLSTAAQPLASISKRQPGAAGSRTCAVGGGAGRAASAPGHTSCQTRHPHSRHRRHALHAQQDAPRRGCAAPARHGAERGDSPNAPPQRPQAGHLVG